MHTHVWRTSTTTGGRGQNVNHLLRQNQKKNTDFTWVRHTETKMRLKCILLLLKAVINERITNDNLHLLGKQRFYVDSFQLISPRQKQIS